MFSTCASMVAASSRRPERCKSSPSSSREASSGSVTTWLAVRTSRAATRMRLALWRCSRLGGSASFGFALPGGSPRTFPSLPAFDFEVHGFKLLGSVSFKPTNHGNRRKCFLLSELQTACRCACRTDCVGSGASVLDLGVFTAATFPPAAGIAEYVEASRWLGGSLLGCENGA
jgi:hypothetical protein